MAIKTHSGTLKTRTTPGRRVCMIIHAKCVEPLFCMRLCHVNSKQIVLHRHTGRVTTVCVTIALVWVNLNMDSLPYNVGLLLVRTLACLVFVCTSHAYVRARQSGCVVKTAMTRFHIISFSQTLSVRDGLPKRAYWKRRRDFWITWVFARVRPLSDGFHWVATSDPKRVFMVGFIWPPLKGCWSGSFRLLPRRFFLTLKPRTIGVNDRWFDMCYVDNTC